MHTAQPKTFPQIAVDSGLDLAQMQWSLCHSRAASAWDSAIKQLNYYGATVRRNLSRFL